MKMINAELSIYLTAKHQEGKQACGWILFSEFYGFFAVESRD